MKYHKPIPAYILDTTRPIPGYPHYRISRDGEVWSNVFMAYRLGPRVRPDEDLTGQQVRIMMNGINERWLVCDLIAMAYPETVPGNSNE